MGGNTQAQPILPGGVAQEGTSSVNVTGMQTPVSQERRGCSLPKSLAASGSQAEAGTGPTQPPAVSGELHSAREQVKTTSNQTHARQLFCSCVSAAARRPGSGVPLLFGEGGEKKYIYIYRQGSPPCALSATASSLCLHGHVGLLFCAGLLGDGGWPARRLRRRGRSPHALLLPGR